jgi:hypothetical protein
MLKDMGYRTANLTIAAIGLVASLSTSFAGARQAPAAVCDLLDRVPADLARQVEPLGERGRTALLTLAESSISNETLCGIAGLSAVGDRRVIPHIAAALRNVSLRDEAYRIARWASYLAGGPDPDLGAAFTDVVGAFDDRAVWTAAGIDGLYLLGEIDHSDARSRLVAELERPQADPALDALVHALARQGEPRVRARIDTLGVEALRARSGNATPEQASRLGEVAFYQLALGSETLADGLSMLGTIAARDQQATAAWAVHTLCARALRRPDQRPAVDQHRASLVAALDQRGVAWQAPKGPVGCNGDP